MLARLSLAAALWAATVSFASACGGYSSHLPSIAEGSPEAELAIAELRDMGPYGLRRLTKFRDAIKAKVDTATEAPQQQLLAEQLARLNAAIDRVGGAKYCSRSNLYWYTDFDAAVAEAKSSGKPILSLRMLGNLTDDLSCANSRFFRSTLYSNEQIANVLREKFVLHWKSVRPVPVITIDFGDGRTLQRTVTGNSAHYVLMPDGRVVDALPGLYGPEAFQRQLNSALTAVEQLAKSDAFEKDRAAYHAERLVALDRQLQADLIAIDPQGMFRELPKNFKQVQTPIAMRANAIAAPKGMVERPLVAATLSAPAAFSTASLDESTWARIAQLHAADAQLDAASQAVIRSENPTALLAGRVAITKRIVEDPLVRIVRTFQASIALDTVKNEYQLHRQIHEWLSSTDFQAGVDALNQRVYAELFLTPDNDPWLGLAPAGVYTALPNDGISASKPVVATK